MNINFNLSIIASTRTLNTENLHFSLSDIPISLRLSSGIEMSFPVHSYPRPTHLIEDQEPVSSLSAISHTDLPYHMLEENISPPTLNLYHYPLRLDNQIKNHPRQDMWYQILPGN